MPVAFARNRSDRPPVLARGDRADERLQRLLAGFILIQSALCGLTVCLALRGVDFTLFEVAVASSGLLMAFAAVAWLAQETRLRTSRRLRLQRRVEKRLLARSIGRKRAAAAAAALERSTPSGVFDSTPLPSAESEESLEGPSPVASRSPSAKEETPSCARWNDPTVQLASPRLAALLAATKGPGLVTDVESVG